VITPSDEERRVAAHIAQMVEEGLRLGVAGDQLGAVETMRPLFYEYGPAEAYVWVRAMLRHVPTHAPGCDCDRDEPQRAIVQSRDTVTGEIIERDIDDPEIPTGIRTLARMIAAHDNGDDDTVLALWQATVDSRDDDALSAIMHRVLIYAVRGRRYALGLPV